MAILEYANGSAGMKGRLNILRRMLWMLIAEALLLLAITYGAQGWYSPELALASARSNSERIVAEYRIWADVIREPWLSFLLVQFAAYCLFAVIRISRCHCHIKARVTYIYLPCFAMVCFFGALVPSLGHPYL